MPDERTPIANNSEDTMGNAENNAKALFADIDAVPGAGQPVQSNSDQIVSGQPGSQAPAPEKAVPQGTPAIPVPEHPYLLKVDPAKFDKEHAEFLKAQGFLKDDNSFDPVGSVKNWREAVQSFTKAKQAIGTYEGQLRALQVDQDPEPELTKDQIKTDFRESHGQLMAVLNLFKSLQAGNANPEEIQKFNTWIESSVQELEDQRDEKYDLFRLNQVRREMGGNKPNPNSDPNTLRQKSNENITEALSEAERTDTNKAVSLTKNLSPLAHKIAAMVYPKLYNKGQTSEEKGQNAQTAVYRLLSEDKDMTTNLIEIGRAMEVSKNVKSLESAAYERGKSDALKGLKGGAQIPTNDPVKPLPSESQESAVQVAKGLYNDIN